MTEQAFKDDLPEGIRTQSAIEAIQTDPEFDKAIEHMLTGTADCDEIASLMANVKERNGVSIGEMNEAIQSRLLDASQKWQADHSTEQ